MPSIPRIPGFIDELLGWQELECIGPIKIDEEDWI